MSWQRMNIKSPLTDDIFVAVFETGDDGETVEVHKVGDEDLDDKIAGLVSSSTESDTSSAAETAAVQTEDGIRSVSQVSPPHQRVASEKGRVRVDGAKTARKSK